MLVVSEKEKSVVVFGVDCVEWDFVGWILLPLLVTVSKLVSFHLPPIFCSSVSLGSIRLLRIGVLFCLCLVVGMSS